MPKASAKASQKIDRNFSLDNDDIKALVEQYRKEKTFPNPYRSGAYMYSIATIVSLGANKWHSFEKFYKTLKSTYGDWFKSFASRKMRNKETGKSTEEKTLQNLQVLQRTRDYALKLLQVGQKVLKSKGAVLDLNRSNDGEILVRLNLDSKEPQKLGRAPKAETPKMASKKDYAELGKILKRNIDKPKATKKAKAKKAA